jgi:hypothetical protein
MATGSDGVRARGLGRAGQPVDLGGQGLVGRAQVGARVNERLEQVRSIRAAEIDGLTGAAETARADAVRARRHR